MRTSIFSNNTVIGHSIGKNLPAYSVQSNDYGCCIRVGLPELRYVPTGEYDHPIDTQALSEACIARL